jgi:hypothetical protein
MTQSDMQLKDQGPGFSSILPEVTKQQAAQQQQQNIMESVLRHDQQQQPQQQGTANGGIEDVQVKGGRAESSSPVQSPLRNSQPQHLQQQEEEDKSVPGSTYEHGRHHEQLRAAEELEVQLQQHKGQGEVAVANGEVQESLQLPVSVPAAAVPSPERVVHSSRQSEALQEFQQQWQQQQQQGHDAGVAEPVVTAWDGQGIGVGRAVEGTASSREVEGMASESWQSREQQHTQQYGEEVSPLGTSVVSATQRMQGLSNPQGVSADGRLGSGSSSSSRPIPPAGGGGGGWLAMFGRSGKPRPAKSVLI